MLQVADMSRRHDPFRPVLYPVQQAHWLNLGRLRLYSSAAIACYAIFFAIWTFRACVFEEAGMPAPGGDFVVFWSAARLALTSGAAAPYDLALLRQMELVAVPGLPLGEGVMPWLYPPTFLLYLLPVGALPYGMAAAVYLAGGSAWYAWAMRRILPGSVWLAGVAFPGVAVVLATGQSTLWLAGCAGLGLACLKSRPALAGVLLALMTVKPHIALIFPVALLCARDWRALGALIATAMALIAVSLLAFGTEPFGAFVRNGRLALESVQQASVLLARMPTVFAAVKMLGAGVLLSYALHGTVAVAALAAVAYAWSRPCSFALRAAVALCAGLLVPAYLYDYDLAFLGLAIAWLGMHGQRTGWLRGERELLAGLWLLPLWGLLVGMGTDSSIGIQPMPAGVMLALALGVWRIRMERRDKAPTGA